jgi:uncharacterized membrane protein
VVYSRTCRTMAAALIGISIAALTTVFLYIVVVLASFFVSMPTAARNEVVVGGLLAAVFTGTFLIAFRKMVSKIGL